MTRGGVVARTCGWLDKEFRSDVPPGKRALALAMQRLCHHIAAAVPGKSVEAGPTQAEVAKHLNCSETSLSRFLSGQSVPRDRDLEYFYKSACTDAGGEDILGISFDELEKLREQAWAERCQSCVALRAERDALTKQAEGAQAEVASLRNAATRDAAELAALRQEVRSLRDSVAELRATRAGLQARLAAQASVAPLPVPRRKGDRQRSRTDASAARRVAQQATELHRDGRRQAALDLLRHTTDVLSPLETASLLQALRHQQQNELADNVIHIYGRDHHDQDILQVTLELHRQGAPDDAGALLRAALG
ncbi:helix-turn-helix domain-containing protein [Streptomyces sp. NPDC050625]|uniref:helix-turn-helix domain-containing protein n=1 Tax=Streptomyces sp. NPDC050625 TaxID=3154629 RepID=UPI00343BF07F